VRYTVGNLTPGSRRPWRAWLVLLVRTITAGELEERLRALEDRGGGELEMEN